MNAKSFIQSPTTKLLLAGLLITPLLAYAGSTGHTGGIQAPSGDGEQAFDIVHTKITTEGNVATFHVSVKGQAGSSMPTAHGKLEGSDTYAYVWPTTIDPAVIGFESGSGILALAATSHPDFDDTPLYDESGDKDFTNDGGLWHSHWVVLSPNEVCGPGSLSVVDIPEGTNPLLPKTWPGLPLLIDRPNRQPVFDEESLNIKVPFNDISKLELANFDGVTAGLMVSKNLHAPLFCVVNVFDVASGDLSLPGKVNH
jgi:hypothetical protein